MQIDQGRFLGRSMVPILSIEIFAIFKWLRSCWSGLRDPSKTISITLHSTSTLHASMANNDLYSHPGHINAREIMDIVTDHLQDVLTPTSKPYPGWRDHQTHLISLVSSKPCVQTEWAADWRYPSETPTTEKFYTTSRSPLLIWILTLHLLGHISQENLHENAHALEVALFACWEERTFCTIGTWVLFLLIILD